MLQHLDLEDWVEFYLVEASMQESFHRARLLEEPLHAIGLECCPLLLCCFFTSFIEKIGRNDAHSSLGHE